MVLTRRMLALAVPLVVLAAGAGLTFALDTSGPDLVWPGSDGSDGSGATVGIPDTHKAVPYSLGSMILCLSAPGSVTIESVTGKTATGGGRVEAFAVRPNPMLRGAGALGFDRKPLGAVGFHPEPTARVTSACLTDDESVSQDPAVLAKALREGRGDVELAVQYSKSTDATAAVRGLVVRYRSDGEEKEVTLDWDVVLCGAGDHVTPGC